MIMHESIVAILFRLFNFGVLIGVFGYLFKKYVLVGIRTRMAEKKRYLQSLNERKDELAQEHQMIVQRMGQEHELGQQLKKKVDNWAQEVAKKHEVREQEKHSYAQSLQERMKVRVQHLTAEHINKRVVSTVLERTQVRLAHDFTDEHRARTFLASIITHMKKRM